MKEQKFTEIHKLHDLHLQLCEPYKIIVENLFSTETITRMADLPFLPARLFKELELRSIPYDQIFKRMMSSGTSGAKPSVIYLDKKNSIDQRKALANIVSELIGRSRLPLLFLDSESQIEEREAFKARGAGILGFMIFGARKFFALDSNMDIDEEAINAFSIYKSGGKKLVYGFTSIIWEEVLAKLKPNAAIFGDQHIFLIHGGGWKKLEDLKIGAQQFNSEVKSKLGVNVEIITYYGMVEQTGSIYIGDCTNILRTNSYNDIIIRCPKTLQPLPDGETGLIQTLSTLPTSYPGHSILTEDLGRIIKVNAELTANNSKLFEVKGRLPRSELRGCSNTYDGS